MKLSNTLNEQESLLLSFRDAGIAKQLIEKIRSFKTKATIMEVCGTHTVALFKTGVRSVLPENINLVSGPGCPVCVTPMKAVEKAIRLACVKDHVLFCFGDMIKVPGSRDNLEVAKARDGANVRVMYSPIEVLEYAKANPAKKAILFGVGFETTVGLFASTLIRARHENIKNLYILNAFKTIPNALDALLSSGGVKVDGFMLPGHVSSIIGERAYGLIVTKYKKPGVITGFEACDMLEGILSLITLIEAKDAKIINSYKRFVPSEGNKRAIEVIYKVFRDCASEWRALGVIPASGLMLTDEYRHFDAEALMDFDLGDVKEPAGCKCGEVIKGAAKPLSCALYKKVCTPSNPIGPCMVSSEGTCAAYYKYGS